MRIKTSITLAEHLLEQIDASTSNRSAFIEQVMQDYFKKLKKAERDARDLELINKNAKWLNEEAQDVLEYQELFLGEMEKEPVA
jgi:metal-responsive CopG/Arc/MetJ family transcriptional regulator